MKVLILVVVVAVALANAFDIAQNSDTKDGRFVSEAIEGAIDALIKRIKEEGLDPLNIERAEFKYEFAPLFSHIGGFVEGVQFTGLSNIIIHSLNFSMSTYRLHFDVSLPHLRLATRNSSVNAVLLKESYEANYSGLLSLKQIRLSGDVELSVDKISGVSIRDLNLDFSLGAIEPKVSVNIQGRDLSEEVNQALNVLVPSLLRENREKINKQLKRGAWKLIKQLF